MNEPIDQNNNIFPESMVQQIGNIVDTGNWDNTQRGRIYSTDGISPALNTVGGGGLEPKMIVAMRGRYKENSQNHITEQQLEMNKDGVCNTLTSIQKDNMVLEKANICVGGL